MRFFEFLGRISKVVEVITTNLELAVWAVMDRHVPGWEMVSSNVEDFVSGEDLSLTREYEFSFRVGDCKANLILRTRFNLAKSTVEIQGVLLDRNTNISKTEVGFLHDDRIDAIACGVACDVILKYVE